VFGVSSLCQLLSFPVIFLVHFRNVVCISIHFILCGHYSLNQRIIAQS
jgi:hypothetical protein